MRCLWTLSLLIPIVACSQASRSENASTDDGSPAELDSTRGAIERANANFERWYAAGHIDSVAALYATDAWLMGPNMPPVVTRDSIAAFWRRNVQMGRWQFTLRTRDVAVNGPLAIERGTFVLNFERAATAPSNAPPSFMDRGNYVVHWVRQGEQWRLKWDIATSEIPQASAAR
jgi:ketosteroid isomerase-like protein